MDIYSYAEQVPLSFSRIRNNALVTGLTVTVSVLNAKTGAILLAPVSCPEVSTGSGIYTYMWSPTVTQDTECVVTYVTGTQKRIEYILLTYDFGSKA